MAEGKYRKLLEPGFIGKVKTQNRILKTGTSTAFYNEKDGFFNDRARALYEALARGGVGLLVVEKAAVDYPVGTSAGRGFRIDDDKYIPDLAKCTELTHKYGCPTFMQLAHMGPMHRKLVDGLQPVSASALSREQMPRPQYDLYHELTVAEIREIVNKFAQAVVRLNTAGFDGIELNAGHAHLLNSFLSRAWNKRQDAYGCQNMENRTRIIVEIMQEIRKRVGPDFPIIVLLSVAEFGLKDGLTPEEAREIAAFIAKSGASALHLRGELYQKLESSHRDSLEIPDLAYYPEPPYVREANYGGKRPWQGAWVPFIAETKKVVNIPVIAVGGLDIDVGERILEEGKADFISLNRPLLADHDLPNKLAAGQTEDIAPCTHCSTCFCEVEVPRIARCRVNAAFGHEREYEIKPAARKKKVLVVGGGPSGLEAARVAAARGHQVTLIEQDKKLGGLVPVAATVKGLEIEDLPNLVRYLSLQAAKSGVAIKLGQVCDEKLVAILKPDTVILAAGGLQARPNIPGIDNKKVVNGTAMHHQLKAALRTFSPGTLRWLTKFYMPLGKRVVIIGGAIQGCELAEFLVKRGKQVTIVEPGEELGVGLHEAIVRPTLLKWLAAHGVKMYTGVKFKAINDTGLVFIDKDGKEQTAAADTIVTALPLLPNVELLKKIEGKAAEVYTVGDCRDPGLIIDAIADGARIGREI